MLYILSRYHTLLKGCPSVKQKFSGQEIADIGRLQRWIILLVLANLIVNVLSFMYPIVGLLGILVVIIGIMLVFQLATLLRSQPAWLFAALMIVPLISLIILLSLNSQATTALKNRGVQVGLMGASSRDLDMLDASFD
jgi:hypothetical protein